MEFTVEHQCQQCGAPLFFEETSRLLHCPYCNVKSFLFSDGCFRYQLPHHVSETAADIIYIPYSRFKGSVFLCTPTNIRHRVIDLTRLNGTFNTLPLSLGLRPQAMKIKFATPQQHERFLKPSLSIDTILNNAENITTPGETLLHRSYIGETISLIYFPVIRDKTRITDAITGQTIAELIEDNEDIFEPFYDSQFHWRINPMAAICPHCGWDLDGEKESVVLTCSNCNSAWETQQGQFSQILCHSTYSKEESNSCYLPFWKMTASSSNPSVKSYADFIRITNQPRVVQNDWESWNMSFLVPAFKIRPKIFLQLARQMTIAQKTLDVVNELYTKGLFPVTLPQSEALQSLTTVFASTTVVKKDLLSFLPRISFKIHASELLYIPFSENRFEIIQKDLGISIQKTALEFGRRL